MSNSYQNDTLQFDYPDGWTLDESRTADGLTVSLQSPYSMFVFLNLYEIIVHAREVADQSLQTMEDEYIELDSEKIHETIAGVPAVGHDVNFLSLDLTNTCWIRAFSVGDQTVLIFGQTNDMDLELGERDFRAICASVKLVKRGKV